MNETVTPPPVPPDLPRLTPLKRFGVHVRGRLVSGFFLLVPIGLSIMVVQFLFNILGVFFRPLLTLIPPDAPLLLRDWAPQVSFIIFVYLIGLLVSLVIGKKVMRMVDAFFLRIPGIKIVYAASKQLMETLSNSNTKSSFQSVVIIDCFFPGYKAIGFLTGIVTDAAGKRFCKVFLPTAPNPTSGYLLLIPEEKVFYSPMDVETAFRMIVSGGMLSAEVMELPPTEYRASGGRPA